MSDSFRALAGEKYLSLETYRRSGVGVRTPVWFAAQPSSDRFYVFTTVSSGKAKRIRNNRAAKLAPCDAKGALTGDWVEAQAAFVTGDEAALGMALLGRKYRPWKQLLDVFSGLAGRKRNRVVLAIRPA